LNFTRNLNSLYPKQTVMLYYLSLLRELIMVLINNRLPAVQSGSSIFAMCLPTAAKIVSPYVSDSFSFLTNLANSAGNILVSPFVHFGSKFDMLAHMWLEFARVSSNPYTVCPFEKKDMDAFNSLLEKIPAPTNRSTVITMSKQKQCESAFKLINTMTQGDSSLNEYRDLATAEVLCKQFAMSGAVQKGDVISLPCVDKDNNSVMIEYEVYEKFDLNNTDIPVYVLRPKNAKDQEYYEPILLFRGTCPDSEEGGVRSLLENMDTDGPARRIYEASLPKIKKVMDDLYPLDRPHNKPKVRVMGYSQGGVLGQRAVVDFAEQVSQDKPSLFFNSAGVEKDYKVRWDNIPEENRPNVKNFLVSRDPISKAGAAFIGELYEIEPTSCDMVSAHFECRLLESGWKIYKLDPKLEEECTTRKLVNRVRTDSKVERVYDFFLQNIHHLDMVCRGFQQRPEKIR
jgi:hypothetical protein